MDSVFNQLEIVCLASDSCIIQLNGSCINQSQNILLNKKYCYSTLYPISPWKAISTKSTQNSEGLLWKEDSLPGQGNRPTAWLIQEVEDFLFHIKHFPVITLGIRGQAVDLTDTLDIRLLMAASLWVPWCPYMSTRSGEKAMTGLNMGPSAFTKWASNPFRPRLTCQLSREIFSDHLIWNNYTFLPHRFLGPTLPYFLHTTNH